MIKILTYQDLLEVGANEKDRMDFVRSAVNQHKSTDGYRKAVEAELYYDGENPTINRYEKILYDLQGKAHRDMYTANHKIASRFFGIAVDQENLYLLGNGVSFKDDKTKEKLGKNFDIHIQRAGEYAIIAGVSFAFWNLDHLEVFRLTEFVPLYDEESGGLKAGIRFWQIDDSKPLRATLFEMDGYTEYIQNKGEDMGVFRPKSRYQKTVVSSATGTEIYDGQNYPGFPVVPLKYNEKCKSALLGKRNTVDALDLATSNMVNNVDEGNLIYWVLTNSGGMDDLDDVKFIERLKTLHVTHLDDDGAKAEPHQLEAPFEGTQATIDMLTKKLYADFQAFDSAAVSAGNQTATAIKASYVPLDLKVDKYERQVTEFINGILEIAGIDDEPTYTRNAIINKMEETQTVLLGAQYYDDEYITQKLLTILGDADAFDEMMKRKDAEAMDRLIMPPANEETNREEIQDGNDRNNTGNGET